jgi:transcriptional regulator with XRE-family HTH domain
MKADARVMRERQRGKRIVNMMTLLKRYRMAAGFSQRGLAKKVGVSVQAYSYWENGRNLPQAKRIKMLAAALEVPPLELTRIVSPGHQGQDAR